VFFLSSSGWNIKIYQSCWEAWYSSYEGWRKSDSENDRRMLRQKGQCIAHWVLYAFFTYGRKGAL
jgi:hypothetical protein